MYEEIKKINEEMRKIVIYPRCKLLITKLWFSEKPRPLCLGRLFAEH